MQSGRTFTLARRILTPRTSYQLHNQTILQCKLPIQNDLHIHQVPKSKPKYSSLVDPRNSEPHLDDEFSRP